MHASAPGKAVIPLVVSRHVEEAALLCNQRLYLVAAPHPRLNQLRRLDDRLAAQLDGIAVAGETGSRLADAALANTGRGELFTAVSLAFENGDGARLQRLFAVAEALPEAEEAFLLAVGWVSAQSLRGISRDMLASRSAFQRRIALAACAMHRVDPGAVLAQAVHDDDAALRARALRTVGDCARLDLRDACMAALSDADAHCRFWAARSALMLGDARAALDLLQQLASQPGPRRSTALSWVLKVVGPDRGAALLRPMLDEPAAMRDAIRGMGTLGDPQVVPWLIAQMAQAALARLAGESFSMITGADLAALDLERKPPEEADAGAGADLPEDEAALDEDGGLPWPDAGRVQDWWRAHAARFQRGTRHFMGATVSVAHCMQVLKDGFQRQRIAAAEHCCLAQPGTRRFPCDAPAWRQQRWLDTPQAGA